MRSLRPALLAIVLPLLSGCNTTDQSKRFTRNETSSLLKKLEVVSLELGEFPFDGPGAVIDGDTVRVKGLQASLRLLAIDTEETFKKDWERQAFAAGWEDYKKKMRGNSVRPVKMATPAGEEAKHFAVDFFEGIETVRLERDHPGEIRDFYGRYLAYIFAKKNGEWVNYNVECVRAGHSPYFVKYGRSRRFHREFVDAQKEAIEAKRGIWKPGTMHYDDYDERLRWWAEREAGITRFEREQNEKPESHIALTRWDAMLKLEQRLGQEVTVLGAVQEVIQRENGPAVVKLARTRTQNFDIVFWDRDVLLNTGLQFKRGEYVQVRGVVQKYRNSRGLDALQMQVTLPGQVLAPSEELEQMLSTDSKAGSSDKDEGE
ncbi:MAG: thermonuclease family protein [Archangium sp.]|nr:thermonuclease family protein [Archangium sp.]MDP3151646.1 thermonuclease family protein [Archangium sp.]MDP3569181.1 thermonuclease family protein [Archangium sp.]